MKCGWCGWHGAEEELDFDEHDVPMYCPECGKIVDEDGEFEETCKRFLELNPDYEIWFDKMESHAGYYPVTVTDKHILQLPSRMVFESWESFAEWVEGVVLD